ncbi:DUF305 domain-containing protein [Pseudonocardia spinosispora]|uniref:DUF305 domain-containing protein n=1 Tax=Pseudonocardia spinosispora TaxID=103441 RepID=UPI0003FF9D8F|nr:DUF305 domain-containing protein [Pseudonocardia spinosispora]
MQITRNTRKMLTVTLALIVATLVGGCGAAGPDHNAADVTFAQQMIPHHAQAVEMAKDAPAKAQSAQVKQLAAAIEAAQQPEIDQMTAMLTRWNAPVPKADDDMAGMDHGSMNHGSMPGMMSDQQMDQLESATGAQYDREFLTMMIGHHQGAVDMSATELRDGSDAEAKALAQKITDAQRTEIAQMQAMLR